MSTKWQILLWTVATIAACTLLLFVLDREQEHRVGRWSTYLVGNPRAGQGLFTSKGCARCHGIHGAGEASAADLGSVASGGSGPQRLATAMWNHGPEMWKRMSEEKLEYPSIDRQEMSHLFAYLFTAQFAAEPGDPARGDELIRSRGCQHCHSAGEGSARPLGGAGAAYTPITWTQAMWNHSTVSDPAIDRARWAGGEMADVLARVQGSARGAVEDDVLLQASPDRGWKLFQEKSCESCHALTGEKGGAAGAPPLVRDDQLPATILDLAGSLWMHGPQMPGAEIPSGISWARLGAQETADLIAFLYSARYTEPGGSSRVGEVIFDGKDCTRCHGPHAEGGGNGPALRGRGVTYSSIALAAALWNHGPKMYARAVASHEPWPVFSEDEVGHLLTFLNTSAEMSGD